MALTALSEILWRERELLEQLLFRLEVEQLLLVNGRTKRLPLATRDVETVLEGIRELELARSVEVEAAAKAYGLDGGASLLELARAVESPWGTILQDHRAAFVTLTAEVAELSKGNRDLLVSSRGAAQETMMGLRDTFQGYDPSGAPVGSMAGSALVDESF